MVPYPDETVPYIEIHWGDWIGGLNQDMSLLANLVRTDPAFRSDAHHRPADRQKNTDTHDADHLMLRSQ